MSTSGSGGFQDGIWEIREYEIIAHYPEGDWRLTALEIESIRLSPEMEEGRPVCDAFMRLRNQTRSDLVGRYPEDDNRMCLELARFAERNRIQLIGEPPVSRNTTSVLPAPGVEGFHQRAQNPENSGMPKSPDSAYQTQEDPNQATGAQQDFDPTQNFNPQQGYDPNQGFHPQQGYDPNQPYGNQQGFDPRQGFPPPGAMNFRSPDWWRWTYDRMNPAFNRNIVLTVLAGMLLMGIGFAIVMAGPRMGSFFSGPGIIFLIILLKSRNKNKHRRR